MAAALEMYMTALVVPASIRAPLQSLIASEALLSVDEDDEKKSCDVMIRAPAFRALVAWLEDAKLRVWPMDGEDRARLRRVEDVEKEEEGAAVWAETFARWLEAL